MRSRSLFSVLPKIPEMRTLAGLLIRRQGLGYAAGLEVIQMLSGKTLHFEVFLAGRSIQP